MVRQDYLFMAMLMMFLIVFIDWGGPHQLRH